MLGKNKGQYQDICTHWLKFQDIFKIQDNFRTTLKFQEFQDCSAGTPETVVTLNSGSKVTESGTIQ